MKPGDLVKFADHRAAYLPYDYHRLANKAATGMLISKTTVWSRPTALQRSPAWNVLWSGASGCDYMINHENDLEVIREAG